jgi:hypothetical protein
MLKAKTAIVKIWREVRIIALNRFIEIHAFFAVEIPKNMFAWLSFWLNDG